MCTGALELGGRWAMVERGKADGKVAIAAAGIGVDARHEGVISSDGRVVEATVAVVVCR